MTNRAPPEYRPWVERLNALGENLGSGGPALVSLEAATVLEAARTATGLDDFGDPGFLEPLGILCNALREEARLTLLGRLMIRAEIQRLLQNRLRIQELFTSQPEILEREIKAPLFVTGLGRSGTTFLHELLWQDPENRVPLLWEMLYPVPTPDSAGASAEAGSGGASSPSRLTCRKGEA